jgi:hypothetical protein
LFASGYSNFYVYAGNDPVNVTDPFGLADASGVSWKNQTAGIVIGAVEGIWGLLAVTGLTQVPEQTFESWKRALDALGVVNYEDDGVEMMLELTGLDAHVDNDSWEFYLPRFCTSLLVGVRGAKTTARLDKLSKVRAIESDLRSALDEFKNALYEVNLLKQARFEAGLKPAVKKIQANDALNPNDIQLLPTFGANPGKPQVAGFNGTGSF